MSSPYPIQADFKAKKARKSAFFFVAGLGFEPRTSGL